MKTQTLIRLSGMILIAVMVSLAVMALVYGLQHPHAMAAELASIGWNG
jgi:hypothetical protein